MVNSFVLLPLRIAERILSLVPVPRKTRAPFERSNDNYSLFVLGHKNSTKQRGINTTIRCKRSLLIFQHDDASKQAVEPITNNQMSGLHIAKQLSERDEVRCFGALRLRRTPWQQKSPFSTHTHTHTHTLNTHTHTHTHTHTPIALWRRSVVRFSSSISSILHCHKLLGTSKIMFGSVGRWLAHEPTSTFCDFVKISRTFFMLSIPGPSSLNRHNAWFPFPRDQPHLAQLPNHLLPSFLPNAQLHHPTRSTSHAL